MGVFVAGVRIAALVMGDKMDKDLSPPEKLIHNIVYVVGGVLAVVIAWAPISKFFDAIEKTLGV